MRRLKPRGRESHFRAPPGNRGRTAPGQRRKERGARNLNERNMPCPVLWRLADARDPRLKESRRRIRRGVARRVSGNSRNVSRSQASRVHLRLQDL